MKEIVKKHQINVTMLAKKRKTPLIGRQNCELTFRSREGKDVREGSKIVLENFLMVHSHTKKIKCIGQVQKIDKFMEMLLYREKATEK